MKKTLGERLITKAIQEIGAQGLVFFQNQYGPFLYAIAQRYLGDKTNDVFETLAIQTLLAHKDLSTNEVSQEEKTKAGKTFIRSCIAHVFMDDDTLSKIPISCINKSLENYNYPDNTIDKIKITNNPLNELNDAEIMEGIGNLTARKRILFNLCIIDNIHVDDVAELLSEKSLDTDRELKEIRSDLIATLGVTLTS